MKPFARLCLLLLLPLACTDGGPTSSSSFGPAGLPTVSLPSSSPSSPSSSSSEPTTPEGAEEGCFASLGINRAGITHRVEGTTLFIYVPASNADYVRVWTASVNQTLLGQGPVNSEFSVALPGTGTFQITLAIERVEGSGVCQYDGHSFTVTTSVPPPPPPKTPNDPDPTCEEGEVFNGETCVPYCDLNPQDERCLPPPPPPECEPVWIAGEPIEIGATDWSECSANSLLGTRSRTLTYHVVYTNQCNDEERFEDYQKTETENCELPNPEPEHGLCLYEVSGRNKEATCTTAGGVYSAHDGSDHCVFDFPGISQNGFNLAPGLSDEDCLRKQDN